MPGGTTRRMVGDPRWRGGGDPVTSTHPARLNRLTREDLRRLLLEEGRTALLEEGFETGSVNLTFKRVFERLERRTGIRLTNASVIRRVWENLADYQADVLVSIAKDPARGEVGGAVDAMGALFADIDLSTPESRALAVQQVSRVGGGASTRALASSTNWSLWINVVAMSNSVSGPEQRQRIKAALLEGYTHVYEFWAEQLGALMAIVGYRVRQPRTLSDYIIAVTAYSEGCSIRLRISDHIDVVTRPTGPHGEDEEWTLFALGLEALASAYLEPDPTFVPPPG
jgi:hypothetical protein